jgi:hypothetical protein
MSTLYSVRVRVDGRIWCNDSLVCVFFCYVIHVHVMLNSSNRYGSIGYAMLYINGQVRTYYLISDEFQNYAQTPNGLTVVSPLFILKVLPTLLNEYGP